MLVLPGKPSVTTDYIFCFVPLLLMIALEGIHAQNRSLVVYVSWRFYKFLSLVAGLWS